MLSIRKATEASVYAGATPDMYLIHAFPNMQKRMQRCGAGNKGFLKCGKNIKNPAALRSGHPATRTSKSDESELVTDRRGFVLTAPRNPYGPYGFETGELCARAQTGGAARVRGELCVLPAPRRVLANPLPP